MHEQMGERGEGKRGRTRERVCVLRGTKGGRLRVFRGNLGGLQEGKERRENDGERLLHGRDRIERERDVHTCGLDTQGG